ncbi:MAG TPA: hypothetical protein VMG11_13915 [Steroidobacteraceae bacterium]|nr:hypothetical protein [Steroidobacteraceae bacterium]
MNSRTNIARLAQTTAAAIIAIAEFAAAELLLLQLTHLTLG